MFNDHHSVNANLMDCLNISLPLYPEVRQLLPNDALASITRAGNQYICYSNRRWWWDDVKVPSVHYQYNKDPEVREEPHDILRTLFPPDEIINCYITDDELPPWPVYQGPLFQILDLIRECQLFEYTLVDIQSQWIVFDTHHDVIVFAGSVVEDCLNHKDMKDRIVISK